MNEDKPNWLEVRIGRRTYRMSHSLLAVLVAGCAVGVLLQIVELYVYFSPLTVGAAKAAALLFGFSIGLQIEIYDDDEDDDDDHGDPIEVPS